MDRLPGIYSEELFFTQDCIDKLSSATSSSYKPNIVPNLKSTLCKILNRELDVLLANLKRIRGRMNEE